MTTSTKPEFIYSLDGDEWVTEVIDVQLEAVLGEVPIKAAYKLYNALEDGTFNGGNASHCVLGILSRNSEFTFDELSRIANDATPGYYNECRIADEDIGNCTIYLEDAVYRWHHKEGNEEPVLNYVKSYVKEYLEGLGYEL